MPLSKSLCWCRQWLNKENTCQYCSPLTGLREGLGGFPQFRGAATFTLSLNSLPKIKLLTLLRQNPASYSPESHLHLYIYFLLCILKKEFYCAFHMSATSFPIIVFLGFLGRKGKSTMRGTSREPDWKSHGTHDQPDVFVTYKVLSSQSPSNPHYSMVQQPV